MEKEALVAGMRNLSLAAIFFALAGCAAPGQHMPISGWLHEEPASPEYELVRLSTDTVTGLVSRPDNTGAANSALDAALRGYEYRVGPKDVLSFIVWDHPELTIPAGEFRSAEIQGHLVSAQGTIFFPYVGEFQVAGLTLPEIRRELTRDLSRYLQNPQLDVRIATFRSKKVNVVGEVVNPGFQPITDIPLTVVEAIHMAGGARPTGSLQRVQLIRNGNTQYFDVQALLDRGDMRQNALLSDGDILYIPDNTYYAVHALGGLNEPGLVPINKGRLNLAEVITIRGGLDDATANSSRIFVFRSNGERPTVFWLDAASADAMLLATQFAMQPQDVVFVASVPLSRWNRVISLILPTIQTLWQTQSFIDRIRD